MATITKASVYERFSETEVCFRDLEKFFETDWDNINDKYPELFPKVIEFTYDEGKTGTCRMSTGETGGDLGGMGFDEPRFKITNLKGVIDLSEIYYESP